MELTKKDVQKRVLMDGKPINLELFDWDIKTRTFKSSINGLVIDFTDIDKCTFETGNSCTFVTGVSCEFITGFRCKFNTKNFCTFITKDNCNFNTGSFCVFNTGDRCIFDVGHNCKFTTGCICVFNTNDNCTFNTGSSCTFDTSNSCVFKTSHSCVFNTGSHCTFDTSNNCVFVTYYRCDFNVSHNCHIIIKPNNVVIKPPLNTKLTTCPLFIPGYLIGTDYYVNDVKQEGNYMVADDILSKILSKKGNVFKVYNYSSRSSVCEFDTTPTYIVQSGDIFAHGKTIKEANESLIYKISNRDASVYNNLTLDSMLTKEEAIEMYRVITGSCEYGVRNFVEAIPNLKDSYSIQEIVELTTGQYGNNMLRRFFKI